MVMEQLADLNYRPRSPLNYAPNIGMIGCGGITHYHLRAYRQAGFRVTALCDLEIARAESRRAEFYPEASVYDDYRKLLADDSIEVVDITTHPPQRPPIIEAALRAGKHVLSQKPFVLDLDEGLRLIEVADKCGRQLAINQNGRWAPHFSYARAVVDSACIGDIFGAHLSCHWDHTWVKGTEFEKVKHLILYDYAIHWFDIVRCFLKGKVAKRVFASTARVPGQQLMPSLLGQALIEFDDAQSTLAFDASVPAGPQERTYLSGTRGSLFSVGSGNQEQRLTVSLPTGDWTPKLIGQWFPDGFHGTMGELLCAIEEGRESSINAVDNLQSLELCFAAIRSAETGAAVKPGTVRKLPD
jgi:predicted dehydrogenase